MDEKERKITDFKAVCLDNISALKKGDTVFVYKKDVLEETIKMCQEKGIDVVSNKIEDYYTIRLAIPKRKHKYNY